MKKYKSIDEVLRRGQILVNVPVFLIFVSMQVLSFFVIPLMFSEQYVGFAGFIGFLIAAILGFFLAWSWWSYRIVKWRIWAFENTEKSDWYELKQRAISGLLIWPYGSIYEKTEFRSKREGEKIKGINMEISKLEAEMEEGNSLESIEDDSNLPIKINYFYQRSEILRDLLQPILFILGGIFLFIYDVKLIGLMIMVGGVFMIKFKKIRDFRNKEIQFSIGNNGIWTKQIEGLELIEWTNIRDILVDSEGKFLGAKVWKDNEFNLLTIILEDYNIIDYEEFQRKINIYRKRSFEQEEQSKNE